MPGTILDILNALEEAKDFGFLICHVWSPCAFPDKDSFALLANSHRAPNISQALS